MPSSLHGCGIGRPVIHDYYLSEGSSLWRKSELIRLDHSARALEWRAVITVKQHPGELVESHAMNQEN
jgi:hypothetical protein